MLYDDDALYVGAKLYDNEPASITAQNLRQNDNIGQDDRFYITLDPFFNRRSGYFFGLNPNGVRADGLYRNVTDFYGAWDTIFDGEAGRFEGGWIAEFAIPFKSISFDPHTDTWGLNFSRGVVRKNENIAWVSRNRAYNPAVVGPRRRLRRARPARARDRAVAQPEPPARLRDVGGADRDELRSDAEPSLDLAYKLTPLLNASLTINTDFSATEVDDRQVNLTRFGLFFPEKRDFFLREADIFEFGRIGGQQAHRSAIQRPLAQNGRPFFSRRIGLSGNGPDRGPRLRRQDQRPRRAAWELGALSIRQDDFGAVERAERSSVVRAKIGVLDESNVGMIATPATRARTSTTRSPGVDFLIATRGCRAAARSRPTPGISRATPKGSWARTRRYGVTFSSRPQGFRGGVGVKVLEAELLPGLGFLDRRGVGDTSGDVGYMHRPRGTVRAVVSREPHRAAHRPARRRPAAGRSRRPFEFTNRTGDVLLIVLRDRATNVLPAAGFLISPGS